MIETYWHNAEIWFLALPFQTQCMLGAILAFWLLFNIFYNEKAVAFGPTILTTLGIFATFLGIAFGLSEFDSNNSHKGHHHFIDKNLVAEVEGNKVRPSAIGAVAVTMEEEK